MTWLTRSIGALYQGWQQTIFALIMLVPLALTLVGIAGIVTVVLIPLLQAIVLSTRQLTNNYRAALGKLTSTPVPVPYATAPPSDDQHPWSPKSLERVRWLLADPATWQDLVWMLLNPIICALTVLLPGALAIYAPTVISFSWLVHPGIGPAFGSWHLLDPTAFLGHYAWLGLPAGLLVAAWMLASAPNNLKALYAFSAALLAPTRDLPISEEVVDLTNAQEAELRRIERDLHDGAQARMVAVGMTLRTVERMLDTNPDAVRDLVVEARETSAAALRDLRALVRGIHPPILAERGLTDALRALALQTPVAVEVHIDLPEPLEPPIEAAVYFAVCELLTNTTKHGHAEHASLTLHVADNGIIVTVGDDGRGGADPDLGSGLSGIRRRLASFSGTLAITSPAGGPTTAIMEIPVATRRHC